MTENQKSYYKNRKSTHTFKIGDLVLLRKHNKDKLELKWEPNYRIIKFLFQWSAIVENQSNVRTERCNIADLKIKLPFEDWDLKPGSIGRAARSVNHPDNLPDIDLDQLKLIMQSNMISQKNVIIKMTWLTKIIQKWIRLMIVISFPKLNIA